VPSGLTALSISFDPTQPRADNAGMAFGLAREYIRTCRECGYTWRVPRAIARQSGRGMSAVTLRGNLGRAAMGGGGSQLDRIIGARAAEIEAFRICAHCGVDSFDQRPVRETDNNIVPGTGGFSMPR
jgi:predicted nucleic-acid-binding Zn-ribbon protein